MDSDSCVEKWLKMMSVVIAYGALNEHETGSRKLGPFFISFKRPRPEISTWVLKAEPAPVHNTNVACVSSWDLGLSSRLENSGSGLNQPPIRAAFMTYLRWQFGSLQGHTKDDIIIFMNDRKLFMITRDHHLDYIESTYNETLQVQCCGLHSDSFY